jgi:non-ribosomal peptide synthetase component F
MNSPRGMRIVLSGRPAASKQRLQRGNLTPQTDERLLAGDIEYMHRNGQSVGLGPGGAKRSPPSGIMSDRGVEFARGCSASLVVDAFEAMAARHADAIAVRFEEQQLTYAELNARANRLARRLLKLGMRPGDSAAICLEPSLLTPIAVLGVLKAGGAYVPVSARDPIERIGWLVQNAAAAALLTQQSLLDKVGSLPPWTIAVDAIATSGEPQDTNLDLPIDPRQTAYILYTSGSSGNPKGVIVPHSALAYYLDWHCRHLREDIGQVDLPLSSSICFAAGVTQLYTPLLLGRTLHVLAHDTIREPQLLFAWFERHPGFGLYCVPTLWNELLRFAETRRQAGAAVTGP